MVNSTGSSFSAPRVFVQWLHDDASPAPSRPSDARASTTIEKTMNTRHLLNAAAIALAFCASGAFAADDGCRTNANGVQTCDLTTGHERGRDAVAAEIHAKADASTGCRTVANGVQVCDVPTGRERSREAVVAELHDGTGYSIEGCRTVANGVQKCDVPSPYALRRDAAVAAAH
jgi:hypothetical protein